MPYGLPHGLDQNPQAVAKMERCVTGLTEKGYEKGRAIAICKASLFGSEEQAILASAPPPTTYQWASALPSLEGGRPGELLLFHDAVLVRAEVNKNKDGIPAEEIEALRETIALMPITKEHNPRTIVGFFTDGRLGGGNALLVDGVIFARRFPEVARDILAGKMGLSVEAVAEVAICGECGTVFDREGEYCEHLRGSTEDRKAVRWLRRLKAIGGAVTRTPAGTDCTFRTEDGKIILTSFLEGGEPMDVWGETKHAHKSPPKGYPEDREQYADPENYKYPIDDEHIRAAIAYFNHEGQREAGGYSEEEWAAIGRRIAQAATKYFGRKYVYRGGKVVPEEEEGSSAESSLQPPASEARASLTPSPEGTEGAEGTEKVEVEGKAEEEGTAGETEETLAALRARIATLEEEKEVLKAQLRETQEKAQEESLRLSAQVEEVRRAYQRAHLLSSVLGEEVPEEDIPALGSLSEAQFQLLLKVGRKSAKSSLPTPIAHLGVEEGEKEEGGRRLTWDDFVPTVAR